MTGLPKSRILGYDRDGTIRPCQCPQHEICVRGPAEHQVSDSCSWWRQIPVEPYEHGHGFQILQPELEMEM